MWAYALQILCWHLRFPWEMSSCAQPFSKQSLSANTFYYRKLRSAFPHEVCSHHQIVYSKRVDKTAPTRSTIWFLEAAMSTEEIDYLKRKNDAWRPGQLQLGMPGIEPESQQRPHCSPHLSVGFLFLILYPAPAPRPPPSPPPPCHTHTQLCHTPSFTHNFVTHLFVTHLFVAHRTPSFTHSFVTHTHTHTHTQTSLSHTIFDTQLCHPPLCHTPSLTHSFATHLFVTYLFVTHHLSHTTLSHTHTQVCHTPLCHTQLCHTPSFTHSFATHLFVTYLFVTHHLSHTTLSHTILSNTYLSHATLSHATLSHTSLSHTISHTQLCHTPLCHTPLCRTPRTIFHTQLCHTQVCHTPLCHTRFTHNFVTGTVRHLHSLCSRRGTYDHGWLWWRAWASCTLRGRRGRRGTWRHPPSFCEASRLAGGALVALGLFWWRAGAIHYSTVTPPHFAWHDIHLRFTWQAWRFQTSTSSLRGRCGTYGTGLALVARSGVVARDAAALCVAGVELGDIHPRFARQTWHLAAFTFVLRGRRGGKHQHEHTWPRPGKPWKGKERKKAGGRRK